MAAPLSRMILSRNTNSLLHHLLRPRLSAASNTIDILPTSLSCAELQNQGSGLANYLLGSQHTVGSAVVNEGAYNLGAALDLRFGGFGEMGRVEVLGKREDDDDLHNSDEDGTPVEEDYCSDLFDDVEEDDEDDDDELKGKYYSDEDDH